MTESALGLPTAERRRRLKEILLSSPWGSLDKSRLAQELKCSRPTVYNDLRALGREIPQQRAETIVTEVLFALDRAEIEFRRIMNPVEKGGNADPWVRMTAARNLVEKQRAMVDLLTKMGVLEKVPDFLARFEYSAEIRRVTEVVVKALVGAGASAEQLRAVESALTIEATKAVPDPEAVEEAVPVATP